MTDLEKAREAFYDKDAELARAEGYIAILEKKLKCIRRIVNERMAYNQSINSAAGIGWDRLARIEKVLLLRASAASRRARSKP